MSEYLNANSISRGARITGWIMSILPVLLLVMSASFKFIQPAGFAESVLEMGYTPAQVFKLGFVEIGCALLYLFPRTAVLGAILLTAYMGGAATHFRVEQIFLIQILVGVLIWGGLYLRDHPHPCIDTLYKQIIKYADDQALTAADYQIEDQ